MLFLTSQTHQLSCVFTYHMVQLINHKGGKVVTENEI